MKKLMHNFIHCGILGWCLEISFTALSAFRRREPALKGKTSLYMFPIYGMAAFLSPICRLLKGKPLLLRGITYALLIFATEYTTGVALNKRDSCPWDYTRSKWNLGGVIRLDYLPYWIVAGLLFERLLLENDS